MGERFSFDEKGLALLNETGETFSLNEDFAQGDEALGALIVDNPKPRIHRNFDKDSRYPPVLHHLPLHSLLYAGVQREARVEHLLSLSLSLSLFLSLSLSLSPASLHLNNPRCQDLAKRK